MKVQLSLHAKKLKNLEKGFRRGKSDPYAVITLDSGEELGRTETIDNNLNPDWANIIYFELQEDTCVPITVQIFDANGDKKDDGDMGVATFELWDVFRDDIHMKEEDLGDGATVYLRVEESQKSDTAGNFLLQLRALNLVNIESGLFGTGRSDPFFEISKKISYPDKGFVYWQRIYRSERVSDSLNPLWEEQVFLSLEALCFGDLDWPLRISIYDDNKRRKSDFMSETYTTAKDLLESVAVKGNADQEKALTLRVDDNETSASKGLIVVLKAELHE
uniref:C2 domain-containing protein n=1 Tax=Helicotheca tamesis TaxID=374047 RepID=A0A6U0HPV8_9STRA|mmetsp:Transcript_8289/g.11408  ORF Transcript_8289/g.11408 Transcript_8289/m.11408 type:complete len:276 (+) Transcript_8289:157-984(+)|eukprot:CAMPEP_0185728512 /NCGR_PEP_ID=MMETSP1171-20130828/3821_1 /TAXON_ID=374046 /ORGANISM="Helicotheca tamensis, Strain CCMP826" /LENGTH=275 /DNA_ID=CAMNT_0028397227 /DNA_START=144 /DNA_END=971 /DNA_ORIENTATION=+